MNRRSPQEDTFHGSDAVFTENTFSGVACGLMAGAQKSCGPVVIRFKRLFALHVALEQVLGAL